MRKEKSIVSIRKEVDVTNSCMCKSLIRYRKLGLIAENKVGREKLISLTPKGKGLANLLNKLIDQLNGV